MLTILMVAALSGMWDDETFLGKGPAGGVGAGVAITRYLTAEGELTLANQRRDGVYLAVDGKPLTATARLSLTMRGRDTAWRPFVSGGVAWVRATEHFATPTTVLSETGFPLIGPMTHTEYRASNVGLEFGAGLEIKASRHISVRPEYRLSFTAADSSYAPGTLEPPLALMRGGVTLIWRSR